MNRKRIVSKMIAAALGAVLTFQNPLQAFAAASPTYLSEVKLSYGDNEEEAKQWLKDRGYTVIEQNLNEKADSILTQSRAVYLGYKTTKDPSLAITDMKVMNMNGQYSYDDYKKLLEEEKQTTQLFIDDLKDSLTEYRANYKAGKAKAVMAHDMMDQLYDIDTGKNMGELLLSPIREEVSEEQYAANPKGYADMTKILMMGNSCATLAIEQNLLMASDTNKDTWLDRLQEIGGYDALYESFEAENKNLPVSKIEKLMAAEYDNDARELAASLKDLQPFLDNYCNASVSFADSEADITAAFAEQTNADYMLWTSAGEVYTALEKIKYEDGTLLEFLTDDAFDFAGDADDRALLYPLIESMTQGQRACMSYVSIDRLLNVGLLDEAGWKTTYEKAKDMIAESEELPVYLGVEIDRFDENIALTHSARELENTSPQSYMDSWYADGISSTTLFLGLGFCVLALSGVALKVGAYAYNRSIEGVIGNERNVQNAQESLTKTLNENRTRISELRARAEIEPSDELSREIEDLDDEIENIEDALDNENELQEAMIGKKNYSTTKNCLNMIGNVLCILAALMMIATVVMASIDLYAYYHRDYLPIPSVMVNQSTDENEKKVYTYYQCVTCNRKDKTKYCTEEREFLGEYGDLNGDIGKEWLALYYTRDANAGKPIVANFSIKHNGEKAGINAVPLTMFGYGNAQNLVDEAYTYNDEVNGLYLYYETDSKAFTGSVFTGGVLALLGAGGAVIGFAVSFLLAKPRKKHLAEEA